MKFGLFILSVLSVKSALACMPPAFARDMDGLPWSEETLEVLESVIERIDRALPELELLENRNKWEDAVKEYNTMWTDAVKGYNTMWKDAMKG